MKLFPPALIALRAALGPALILGALQSWPGALLVTMLAAGTLSDIFDGIIARARTYPVDAKSMFTR